MTTNDPFAPRMWARARRKAYFPIHHRPPAAEEHKAQGQNRTGQEDQVTGREATQLERGPKQVTQKAPVSPEERAQRQHAYEAARSKTPERREYNRLRGARTTPESQGTRIMRGLSEPRHAGRDLLRTLRRESPGFPQAIAGTAEVNRQKGKC